MQLLALVIPALEKMSKEGEEGRKKLTQITRIVAVVLAVVQAIGIVVAFKSYFIDVFSFESGADNPILTMALTIVLLVGGSVMVMWLSERITEYGIGNGTSIIIFIGILSTAGTTMAESFKLVGNEWTYIWNIIGFILVVVAVLTFIVFMDGAERRITVQYSKQIKGNKMYGGQSTYIPIRVNGSGVMPIISHRPCLCSRNDHPTLLQQHRSGSLVCSIHGKRHRGLLRTFGIVHPRIQLFLCSNPIQSRRRIQKHSTIRRIYPRHKSGQTDKRLPQEDQQQNHLLRSGVPHVLVTHPDFHLQSSCNGQRHLGGSGSPVCELVLRNRFAHRRVRRTRTQQATRIANYDEALQRLPQISESTNKPKFLLGGANQSMICLPSKRKSAIINNYENIILLGAPGAGKGTQAAMIAEEFKVPHISTGDILRRNMKEGTPLGLKAKAFVESGGLVPDEVVIGLVEDRLSQEDCKTDTSLTDFPEQSLRQRLSTRLPESTLQSTSTFRLKLS